MLLSSKFLLNILACGLVLRSLQFLFLGQLSCGFCQLPLCIVLFISLATGGCDSLLQVFKFPVQLFHLIHQRFDG